MPGLDGVEYVQGDNLLGVALAALMKIPKEKVAWLGAEALRKIKEAPISDQQKFLLGDCVQAYLPMDDEQQREFEQLLTAKHYEGVKAMNLTSFDKGMEKGKDLGQRGLVHDQLQERFGPLAPPVLERLSQMPADRLPVIGKALIKAQSLQELGLAD